MKALFKHLSVITQGKPGLVANKSILSSKNISNPFLSTTLLTVLLGVPQVPITGGGKAVAQATGSCPVGTAPQQVRLNPSDSLQDLTQEYNIGGIRTVFTLTEEVPGQIIDRTESRVDDGVYGGIQGPDLRLNIGPGKPPETGNLAAGSATLTITFAQPVTLQSPLTLLDVDRNGARDRGRIFQDTVTVTASNTNNNVPVTLQALGPFTRIDGNTAFGQVENSRPQNPDGNVSVDPNGAVDQIRIVYTPGTQFGQPGQDQTIGLAPFTICAPLQPGSIGDTVYQDTNGDGTQNPGEPGIPGINLTLINPGPDGQFGTPDDTTETTTTDNNGIYNFPVAPGNYRVTVDNPPAGLAPTQTPPETIVVGAGENFEDADFGFSPQQIGSIGDTVYSDDNRNNQQDPGENGIPGATVTLIDPGADGEFGTPDDTNQTTTTNEQGIYTFSDLPAGNYRVTATSPRQGDVATQTQPDTIALQPGQNIDTVDFGFAPGQTASIGDTVYTDTNRNNVQDPGELGLPGATVTLINPGADGEFGTPDDTNQTTTTNDQGIYTFSDLPAGNYRVTATSPRQGDVATQTQPDTIALQPGQNIDTVDFGFAPEQLGQGSSSIGDTVYNDTNRNNQQDPGENGIPGVTVTLINPGPDGEFGTPDDTTQTTTTNENGIYGFQGLNPGDYRVVTTTPDGLTPTQVPPETVTLETNQNLDTVDFGFAPEENAGSIGDTVYNDLNRNNVQDNGETGIPGVTVTLTGAGPDGNFGTPDDINQSTTTNENGIYGFTNLPAGNYRVTTTTPNGLTPTQTQPDIINLQSGQNIDTIDFGFAGQEGAGSIGDTVFNDTNGNGVQDFTDTNNNGFKDPNEAGEAGIPGVQLTLRDSQGNQVATTTTNENGNYTFENLTLGSYTVESATPQGTFSATTATTLPANLTEQNPSTNQVDFGFRSGGSIGDTVFNDTNGNGVQDFTDTNNNGVKDPNEAGEAGISGVQLTLRDSQGNQVATTTTNENGNYTFDGLELGDYTVESATPNNLSPTTETTLPAQLTEENPSTNQVDFGFRPGGSIGDTVFRDENGNGVQDFTDTNNNGVKDPNEEGEAGIPGVQLTLRDSQGNQVATTTNENGNYTFPGLAVGEYTVESASPEGAFSPTTATTISANLTEESPSTNQVDFGFRPGGSIGDTVFNDTNGNGVQDFTDTNNNGFKDPNEEGEGGIEGVQLTLRDSQGNEISTTTTNINGNYTFPGVAVGNYQVEATRPTDFSATTDTTLAANLTDQNPSTNDIDFGFRPGRLGEASPDGPVNLRLVKRITAINQQRFNTFTDDPSNTDDNDLNGQQTVAGILQQNNLSSGDEVEYTIYFLKDGADQLNNVRICDLVPANTTLVDNNVQVQGGTNPSTQVLGNTEPIPADFTSICRDNGNGNLSNGNPTEGAVLVTFPSIGTAIQTGFIRFRVQIK